MIAIIKDIVLPVAIIITTIDAVIVVTVVVVVIIVVIIVVLRRVFVPVDTRNGGNGYGDP